MIPKQNTSRLIRSTSRRWIQARPDLSEVEVLGLLAIRVPRMFTRDRGADTTTHWVFGMDIPVPIGSETEVRLNKATSEFAWIDNGWRGCLTTRGWDRYVSLLDRPLDAREQFHRDWERADLYGEVDGLTDAHYTAAAFDADLAVGGLDRNESGDLWAWKARTALADPNLEVIEVDYDRMDDMPIPRG